jgi:hypothetical protein
MTKGRVALPLSVVAEQNPFFSTLGGRRPITSPVEMTKERGGYGPQQLSWDGKGQISPLRFAPVEMTKGRAALPLSVVAEQNLFFISLGGPTGP